VAKADQPASLFPDPPAGAFVAWRRPRGGRWKQVGSAESEADTWTLLYEAMDADRSGSWDNCVLPRGEKP
jgi:hypothetical protein